MMVELSVIRDLIAIFGVIAGFSYYVMTVRNQSKTRQIQLISQLSSYLSEEYQLKEAQLFSFEWEDYNDFEEKYGSDKHPDNFALRYAIMSDYNRTGYILKMGLIDIEVLMGFFGGQLAPLWLWHKYESIVKEQRIRYKQPELFDSWEYLANEIQKYYKMKGHTDIIPENYSAYVPDA
jgi:hypothetical protein